MGRRFRDDTADPPRLLPQRRADHMDTTREAASMQETLADAMARVKAEASLADYCDTHLEARGRGFYVCPVCESGNHKNGSAAFHVIPGGERWKCHSCGATGDIYDLAAAIHGTDDKAEQLEAVASWAGVEGWRRPTEAERNAPLHLGQVIRDDGRGRSYGWDDVAVTDDQEPTGKVSQPTSATKPSPSRGAKDESREVEGNVPNAGSETDRRREREYVLECQKGIGHPDAVAYLSSRGIDLETARTWGLGYDPNAGGAKRADGSWCRRGRIVIPWHGSTYYHIDRSIDPTAKDGKYIKPKGMAQPIYNPEAITSPAFFVTEGAFDALAVMSCGYEAVALGSTSNGDLIKAMKAAENPGAAIIFTDLDEPGRKASATIRAAMESAGLVAHELSSDDAEAMAKDGKDPDELRRKKPRGFSAFLGKLYEAVISGNADERPKEETVLERLRVMDPSEIAAGIYDLEDAVEPIPTGMSSVDEALGGGLPSRGLVAIGAVSSVGKTTWCVQVCDNLAAAGRVVLFVTVEQSAQEIVAKSLSRLTSSMARHGGGRIMASAQHVMSATERAKWDRGKVEAFKEACNRYHHMTHGEGGTQTLHIMEGTEAPTVADVRAAAEAIAKKCGTIDAICIDYLQLLAAAEGHERDSDKARTDYNVMALRQMARDLRTCVMVISSLNRASYNGAVDLASFKESGAVEYGSDVLLGLQPRGMEEELEGDGEATAKRKAKKHMRDFKAEPRRECELVILKNRHAGLPRYGVPLVYEAMCNTFLENEAEARAMADAGRPGRTRL